MPSPSRAGARASPPRLSARSLDAVFTTTDFERVYARADVLNGASRRVLEKVGMVQVGEVRGNRVVHGRRTDDAFYAVLKTDWPPARDASG